MCRLAKRCVLFIGRILFGSTCPECGAYHGHAPSCNLASREEILKTYMWSNGEFSDRLKVARDTQDGMHLRIVDLTNENKMRRKEVQALNAKIRKMSNGQAT